MSREPRGEGGGISLGQQVEDLVGLCVDHGRSVDVAASEREVVHADGAGLRRCRVGQVHHPPQHKFRRVSGHRQQRGVPKGGARCR
ncbi:hypothetical protein AB0G32_13650 [Streptomyces sp. NPDC023723]|uniref:hypothetical protein n=1 Tax=Streptomyces sp. NPDC023723 TaxID=3154323 RepID=UPI0033DAF3FD